jgi:hypothetical protein
MDPDPVRIRILDPDPAIFVIDLQDASKKLIFNTIFSAYYFLKVHLHHFSKVKSQKESQNRRNQGFSYYFCMNIEGSGAESGSGPIPLTSGSGSGRPKNMWIRCIRIRNTAYKTVYITDRHKILLHKDHETRQNYGTLK